MGWVREVLREWICPELTVKTKKVVEFVAPMIQKEATPKSEKPRIPFHEHQQVPLWEHKTNLARKTVTILSLLERKHHNIIKDIESEMGSMFYRFPGKKRVPVKKVLSELLDELDLEIVVHLDKGTEELIPRLKKKMYRYPEEK